MRWLVISAVLVISPFFGAPTFASTTAKAWQGTRSWDVIFTQYQTQSQQTQVQQPKLQQIQPQKTQGVVALWNENKQQGFTNSVKRANQGFLPASTFKIPNSLIALDLGIVKDEHQVFKWDGQIRDIDNWNRDQTLITAMKYSVVPVYQEFAR